MYFKILLDAADLERIDESLAEWIRTSFNKLTDLQRANYIETRRRIREQSDDQQK